MKVIRRDVTIPNRHGLHLRPAAMFTQTVSGFKAAVYVIYNGQKAEGRSLLEILKLGVKEGSRVTLAIDGPDEKEAMEVLVDLFSADSRS